MSLETSFSTTVLNWFDQHGRKQLPWQETITPYRVWVSEIMLQQTQVATVIPYFQRFMRRFCDVATLASAEEDDVLHYWSGLGYYSRARNLHKAAKQIVSEFNGQFPPSVQALVTLPGIGLSTAGAIASISMGIRAPILDGNVKRVLSRVKAIPGWPGKSSVTKKLWAIADELTPDTRTGDYTQAMMDLGAMVCTRTNPLCSACPLVEDCLANQAGNQAQYPGRKPKKTLPEKSVSMLMIINEQGETLLQKRPSTGVWGGLWSFPETSAPDKGAMTIDTAVTIKLPLRQLEHWRPFRHTFSHYHLDITPIKAFSSKAHVRLDDARKWRWYQLENPLELGLAAPVTRLMKKLKASL
ncbi:A/G-specific adenine glycosylase [Candidatus Sororendozoicomonas aggregata]|uniref:A/G-specific adenine glycosylase n=1 Tax=Candidatus Sororendozoicomonas aggregata TaxID=3073239 RepID=UPI002ED2A11C